MGFLDSAFDDIKGVAGLLGETLHDAGWVVGAPVAAAFDIAKAGLPGGEPFVQSALKAVTTGFERGTQLFFGDQTGPDAGTQNIISPGIKTGLDALDWVYRDVLAQPINTANILSQRGLADLTGTEDNASPFDIGSAWNEADAKTGGNDGKGTSIGREWANTMGGVQDLVNPGNWGRDGRFSSLTPQGQQALDEHSRAYDIESGLVDATSRMFLDPTIVLGKGAKALRISKTIAAVKDPNEIAGKLAQSKDWLFDGWGSRFDKAIAFASEKGRTQPELTASFAGLREATDGPAIASVIEQTNKTLYAAGKTPEEVQDQVRLIALAATGHTPALLQIDEAAAFAKDALAAMQSTKDDLKMASEWATQYSDRVSPQEIQDAVEHFDLARDLSNRGRDYFTSDEFVRLTDARLKSVSKDISAAEREAARQVRVRDMFKGTEDTVSKFGVLSDQPMLASALGSTKGLEKRAARERGEQVGLDFVFQSTAWNKGVKYLAPHIYLGQKAVGSFGKMQQPGRINIEDEHAPLQLDAFLKHSKLDPEVRLGLVSKLAAANGKIQKGQVVDEAIQQASESLVRAYRESNPHFTADTEKLVNTALQMEAAKGRTRLAAHTQMFTAHKREVDTEAGPAGSRADLRVDDDGMAKFVPLLETQQTSEYGLPDLRKAEHVLHRHSNWMTDMAAWTKGDRAPDPKRIEEIARNTFDVTAEKFVGFDIRTANRAQALNDFIWKAEENSKLLLEGFNKYWKYATLALRPQAYSMRINIDSGMRMSAALGPAAWVMHSSPRVFGYATFGGASRARTILKSFHDKNDELVLRKQMEQIELAWKADRLGQGQAVEADIANFEGKWRASNDGPIESIDQFLARQRGPEPGIRYQVTGDPEPKLLRIDRVTKKRVESNLDYMYRVVSADDYARMKASGYLDTRFDEHLDGAYHSETEANQVGMFAQATVDKMLLATYGKAPGNVVMRIRVKPGDGWVRDTLDKDPEGWPLPILSTTKRLPFDRVTDVSPRFKGGDERSIWRGDPQVTDLSASEVHADLLKRRAALKTDPLSDPLYDAMKAEHGTIKARLDLYRTGGRKGRRDAYGAFGEAGNRDIKTRAGDIKGAFQDERGKQDRWLISSETSAAIMGDSSKLALKNATTGSQGYIDNTDIDNHMPAWLHAVNAQLLQSVIGKKAVEYMVEYGDAEKATARLARWATGTPEGRKLMGELQWTWADKKVGAREVIGYVNHYLPSPELQAKAAKEGRVKQVDLESALPNIEDRPPVHGESIAIVTGRGSVIGAQINEIFSSIMRWAGDATEDQLARHPMYAAVYEQEVKRRSEFLMADPNIESLTGGDIKRLVQDQAHKKGRQAIKDYMFDVATTSDLSHYMRFTSPFIAAWEDTVRKWGRIAKENPDIAGKAYLVWNAPNDMGIVVDAAGNPVDQDTFTDNTYIVIPHGISKRLPKFLGGGGDTDFRISKQSFNLVLQGGLQPGFGPLVAYPVGKIQTAAPQLNDIAKIVNPYGPPSGAWDAMAPSVLKAVADAVDGQSRTHQQDTRRLYAQMLTEYRLDPEKFGNKEPDIMDASKRAGALGRLKILNRVVNPFPAIFDSPYRMYSDAYHILKDRERTEKHPRGWADDEFIKGYGETYFSLVQSESKNNSGLGSTAEAVQASKQYEGLIAKYGVESGQPNKNLTRLIVGQEGEGAFNASAHQWQQSREISPASGVNYRSYDNPQEAQAQADAALGWYKWRQFSNNLDALALEKGLKTYQDDPELVATRKQFVQNLQKEIPAWHVEWSQRDGDKFERDLKSLGEVADSGKFGPMRTDMVGVKDYLALRQALKEQLAQFGISEGSQDALPFRQEFSAAVQDLVSQNTQFAEWSYYTFLERDPLLEPIAAPAVGPAQAPIEWGI